MEDIMKLIDCMRKKIKMIKRARRNAAYLKKLDKSFEEIKSGHVVRKTLEELIALERE